MPLALPLFPAAHGVSPIAPGPATTEPWVDAQNRHITYLRLSVIDRCNYRCSYCSPASWGGMSEVLSTEEIVRLTTLFASRGVRRVRLTGGEPLIRPDFTDIVRGVSAVEGIEEVCVTTNGHYLEKLAKPLLEAGVNTVNVSLDTLDPDLFAQLTRRQGLDRVLLGVRAVAAAGVERLGINTVVMPGQNDDPASLASLVRFAWDHGAVPRFIELMPFVESGEYVSNAVVRERLAEQGIETAEEGPRRGAGPASYFAGADGRRSGRIGFIGAMSDSFCGGCNRVRVSCDGQLFACLGGRKPVELRGLLRSGAPDEALVEAIRGGLNAKADGHRFNGEGTASALQPMMSLGG